MIKKKPICKKGIGNAIGFDGCGKEVYKKTYGLCDSCLYDFYTTDERGKIIYKQKRDSLNKSKWKEEKKVLRDNTKTLSQYKSDLQKEINTLVRELDKGHNCISSGLPLDSKFDAGHLFSRGSNPSLAFNLMNIYGQSVYANQWKSGDQINYIEGLEATFGYEHKEYVLSLKKLYPIFKLTSEEIKPKIEIVRSLIKWVKFQDRKFSNEERILYRKEFNYKIGVYA